MSSTARVTSTMRRQSLDAVAVGEACPEAVEGHRFAWSTARFIWRTQSGITRR
jgi:hypothetical protein